MPADPPPETSATPTSPTDVVRSLHRATRAHDLDGIVAHFADDYVLDDPSHPDRSFRGREQVRRNWSQILAGIPDLTLEEHRLAEDGSTVWTEITLSGHRSDGADHRMRGVMIFTVRGAQIVAGRFYLAPVVHDGLDADHAVRAATSAHRP